MCIRALGGVGSLELYAVVTILVALFAGLLGVPTLAGYVEGLLALGSAVSCCVLVAIGLTTPAESTALLRKGVCFGVAAFLLAASGVYGTRVVSQLADGPARVQAIQAPAGMQARSEREITGLLENEPPAEVWWYQHPDQPAPPALLSDLVPQQRGGSRITEIARVIATYRCEHHRQAPDATADVNVISVTVAAGGNSATAETRESWYQPIVDGYGKEVPISISQMYQQSAQVYTLDRIRGRWLIASDNAPTAQEVINSCADRVSKSIERNMY